MLERQQPVLALPELLELHGQVLQMTVPPKALELALHWPMQSVMVGVVGLHHLP